MSFTLDQPGEPDEDGNPTVVAGSRPQWITAPITKVSADFAKTVAGANYWMVYSTGKDNAIGAATASSSAVARMPIWANSFRLKTWVSQRLLHLR